MFGCVRLARFVRWNIDEDIELHSNILTQAILSPAQMHEWRVAQARLSPQVASHLIVQLLVYHIGCEYAAVQVVKVTRQLPHIHAFTPTAYEHVHNVVMIGVLQFVVL